MKTARTIPVVLLPLLGALLALGSVTTPVSAQSVPAIGPRIGLTQGPDHLYIGGQLEFRQGLGTGRFSPSLDLGFDDDIVTVFHGDVRWYLFDLPESGLRFYGAAGPALVLSPDEELGLNLTAGLHVPMKAGRRYNVELRFGFGDVPDLKLGLAIAFPMR